jgi:hypothetical protein
MKIRDRVAIAGFHRKAGNASFFIIFPSDIHQLVTINVPGLATVVLVVGGGLKRSSQLRTSICCYPGTVTWLVSTAVARNSTHSVQLCVHHTHYDGGGDPPGEEPSQQ